MNHIDIQARARGRLLLRLCVWCVVVCAFVWSLCVWVSLCLSLCRCVSEHVFALLSCVGLDLASACACVPVCMLVMLFLLVAMQMGPRRIFYERSIGFLRKSQHLHVAYGEQYSE